MNMNAIVPSGLSFRFGGTPVRVELRDGDPWFVAKDVCECLGIEKPENAYARLEPDERETIPVTRSTGDGEIPGKMTLVSEAGLYSLVLGSRKPEACAFKRWVTHEVLPAIRRTGGYGAPPALTREDVAAIARTVLMEIAAAPGLAGSITKRELAQLRREKSDIVQLGLRLFRWKTKSEGARRMQTILGDATGGWGASSGTSVELMPSVLFPVALRCLRKLRIELERQDAVQNASTPQGLLAFPVAGNAQAS